MARERLEVADVFRHFGPAFRDQHGASLSPTRWRAMNAIESCRTAALGGHVERCDDCGHQRVAYNSCRNRNCPKCQGLARAQWLEDRQAEQIVTVELEGRSSMADYLVIASGRAQRQIAAIADYLREAFMKLGVRQVRIEGLPEANWVLVDAGDIVVHLFRPEVRDYYRLEDIWDRRN